MLSLRRFSILFAVGALLLASCGNDSEGRIRNNALPETSESTSESGDPTTDSLVEEPTEGGSETSSSEPEVPASNTVVIIDVIENEQGEFSVESTQTSAPADVIQQGESDEEVVVEENSENGGQQVVSNRINICHATGNGKYVEIAVDSNGLNGHGDHADDIIPAPTGGCSTVEAATTTSTSTTTTTTPPDPNERKWLDDSLGAMRVGELYSDGISSQGPGGVMGYIMSNGTIMPPGLSLDFGSGRVTGVPTKAGRYSFSVYSGFWGCICGLSKSFSVVVEEPLEAESPTWIDTGLGLIISGIAYSDGVSASPKPQSYSITGTLPPGLSFDTSTGGISGTPSAPGSWPFTVTAQYSQGSLAPLNITAEVTASIEKVWADDTLGAFALNTPYNDGVMAKGGGYLDGTMRGVMGYIISRGSLPPGINLDFESGRLTGTPTQVGTYRFTIYAGFWALYGLSLDFTAEVGEGTSTTVAAETDVSDESEDSSDASTDTTEVTTEDTTADTSTETTEGASTDTTVSSAPASSGGSDVQGQAPQTPTLSLVDIVAPDQIIAQVLPEEVVSITCDSGCIQLLVNRVGIDNGTVYARVNSTEWLPLDASNGAIEFALDADVTDIQVKVVADDGATYVMQGQAQREGAGESSSMSPAIWWLLIGLILLIAVAVIRERRKSVTAG